MVLMKLINVVFDAVKGLLKPTFNMAFVLIKMALFVIQVSLSLICFFTLYLICGHLPMAPACIGGEKQDTATDGHVVRSSRDAYERILIMFVRSVEKTVPHPVRRELGEHSQVLFRKGSPDESMPSCGETKRVGKSKIAAAKNALECTNANNSNFMEELSDLVVAELRETIKHEACEQLSNFNAEGMAFKPKIGKDRRAPRVGASEKKPVYAKTQSPNPTMNTRKPNSIASQK